MNRITYLSHSYVKCLTSHPYATKRHKHTGCTGQGWTSVREGGASLPHGGLGLGGGASFSILPPGGTNIQGALDKGGR